MDDIAKDHGDVKYTSQLFLSRSWICAPKILVQIVQSPWCPIRQQISNG